VCGLANRAERSGLPLNLKIFYQTPLSLGRGVGGEAKKNAIRKIPPFSLVTTPTKAWLGKTRGAIGFALIFLWLLSLYQDKESNDCIFYGKF
jgi:hypothetical protein